MKVMTGVCDYNTAVRQACFALADSGLRTVYYASGRSDRIEVAVRRALMTSVSQLTQKISEQNAAEFGADGWEISAHMGARPSHAVYQGRQYPNSQYETIVLPLITDYNCRHSAYPIIMGVTKPAYTDEELAALDPPPFTYEGRRYTAYEAQQQMRKMERTMRRQKDRCIVADAVGDKDAFTAASIKLRRQKDYYEDFCKAAGTYTEYERTFVSGYNRQLAAKTGAVTRKQNAFKNAQITLTNIDESVTIEEKVKSFITLLSSNAINLKIKPRKQSEHTLGSAEWRKRIADDLKNGATPTSMLYSSVDIDKLLKKFSGKGNITFRDKKQIYPIEFVTANDYIGKVWDSGANRYVNTKRFVIRYSKDGVHMHPVKERE